MMENSTLNLARKWRSGNFDQIVGQAISIRILKNSLYLGHYFPVYLFSGQRGCGKTSTARVFAAALNCKNLATFQKNPQNLSIPCQSCTSCIAMKKGKHPDFIEVDGASHTGVDNIRNIIEASTLLPTMGQKKIYLIDEAHMLSKASFNAFLKILEEPPVGVLFILATTAPEKIIDTVRSRCFQLFFDAIDHDILCKHLQTICQKERIEYEKEALYIIVRTSEGSARDALNLLEQIRFSNNLVTVDAVLHVLGHIDDAHISMLLQYTLTKNTKELLLFLEKINIEQYCAQTIWQRLFIYVHALFWYKHGVQPTKNNIQIALLEPLVPLVSEQNCYKLLRELYEKEQLFEKTKYQHAFLETLLLTIVSEKKNPLLDSVNKNNNQNCTNQLSKKKPNTADIAVWKAFLDEIDVLKKSLLHSIFLQGSFIKCDEEKKEVTIVFGKNLIFFNDTLTNSQKEWKPIFERLFGAAFTLRTDFTGPIKEVKKTDLTKPTTQLSQKQPIYSVNKKKSNYKARTLPTPNNEPIVDVSDIHTWPIANTLLNIFPGKITKVEN